jgi:Trypsin
VIDVVIARDSSDNVTQLQQPDFLLDSSNSQHTDTPATPPSYNHQRVRVKQELKHPLYDASTLRYDIMLLQLEHAPIFGEDENSETSRMTFPFMRLDTGDSLLAIESNETTPLPEASRAVQIGDDHPQNRTFSEELNDDVLLALGWGHTQYSRVGIGHPSDYLQQAGLGLVPNQECSQAQEGLWLTYNDRISEEMLCTFAASRDACYGKCSSNRMRSLWS